MRNLLTGLLAGTAALALSASLAASADLPYRGAPQPAYNPMPVFTWTGFYVGANAGYGWSAGTSRTIDPAFGAVGSGRSGGFVGGGQVGYNYQMGMFVLGVEADLQYAGVGNKGTYFGTTYYKGDSDGYFGTVRARAGVAMNNALLYATGGFAYGDVGGNNAYDPGLGIRRGDSDTNGGWTLGGGVEYGFTNNITAKVEGLYVNLDTSSNYELGTVYNRSRDTEFGVVRAGLNYKFN
jgi:outer membrane immunogenic protein